MEKTTGSKEIYEHISGTLVVWSKLDKIQWRTGRTIIDNTSREVGRIHRHFIGADITRIRTAFFLENQSVRLENEGYVVANDPLYLMSPTSTPEDPWASEPMFDQWASKCLFRKCGRHGVHERS